MTPPDPRPEPQVPDAAALDALLDVAAVGNLLLKASAATCNCGLRDTGIWMHDHECIVTKLTGLVGRLAAALRALREMQLLDHARMRTLIETRDALRAQVAADHPRCGMDQCYKQHCFTCHHITNVDADWPCARRRCLGIGATATEE